MIKEKAFAKINLFLNVVSKRIDGYHDLEMVMAPIDLFDVVSFKPLSTNQITIKSETFITERDEDNLCYKVAKYLQNFYNIPTGVEIIIQKNIPIAAGLAGGSADAAATLRGLNKLWKLKLSLEELAKIGLEFGSDIPFCIHNKLCVAKGRGEELMFFDLKLNFPLLLVNPNVRISTKEVFNNVTEYSVEQHKISDMCAGIYNRNLALITRELHNSLEPIVFDMEPQVKELKDLMLGWGVEGVLMSGSGATVFGISTDKNDLQRVFETINDQYFKIMTKIR